MFSLLRNRFGIPGVISVIALVFAMFGGAYAATNNGGKATASAKAKKGPPGPRGKTGPAGPVGPAGPAGAAGAKGDKGDAGSAGNAGAAGKSVTTTHLEPGEGPLGEKCEEGGTEFTSASGTEVICNGEEGPTGPSGPTCNASGECLLPVGATETGVWKFQKHDDLATYFVNISFPLRLVSAPEFKLVTPANSGTPGAVSGCPGTAAEPKAAAGKLCFYEKENFNVEETNPESPADPTSGMDVSVVVFIPAENESASGTWAVTR